MGIGTFNLMISHMPGKVLRLLEFVGFSGNRSTGFRELEHAVEMSDGLRSPLAKLIMLSYYCYVEHLFGLGNEDLSYASDLLSNVMKTYPNVRGEHPVRFRLLTVLSFLFLERFLHSFHCKNSPN